MSLLFCSLILLLLYVPLFCDGGFTSPFLRKYPSVDMPFDSDVFATPPGYNAPQQVHLTQGDQLGRAMIVSWVTEDEPGLSVVHYWSENTPHKLVAQGRYVTYRYFNYASGFIHHCTLKNLEYDTKYYYKVGIGHTERQFWFVTPPEVGPDVPYTFGLIGGLGQTSDSNKTLT
ncbi:purple acid phosphatase-like, partial [Gastrolobium bilobum]|uniref:purple acid phosphatase-like n=1 Tax=Gastrolobium bilobum TaxID=150636 RepID=UPI002AB2F0E4